MFWHAAFALGCLGSVLAVNESSKSSSQTVLGGDAAAVLGQRCGDVIHTRRTILYMQCPPGCRPVPDTQWNMPGTQPVPDTQWNMPGTQRNMLPCIGVRFQWKMQRTTTI
eukprot:364320-Chlamydomonas_euryale.AAC.5